MLCSAAIPKLRAAAPKLLDLTSLPLPRPPVFTAAIVSAELGNDANTSRQRRAEHGRHGQVDCGGTSMLFEKSFGARYALY